MIFDTDVLVWAERGNKKALEVIGDAEHPAVSIFTYMELVQGARSAKEVASVKEFLREGMFQVFPLTENIGHRALIYVEEYGPAFGVRADDAIIAATAIENNFLLVSGNEKHYRAIKELKFQRFKPL